MRRLRPAILGLIVCLCALGADNATAGGPLVSGVTFGMSARDQAAEITAAGGTTARISLDWSSVAPRRPTTPTDPDDAVYRWDAFDKDIGQLTDGNLDAIVDLVSPPSWAKNGAGGVDDGLLEQFARAAALRYSGSFDDLPRVRYWQVWNEPNLSPNLSPQLVDGKPVAPARYRAMVNAVAAGVKSVHADNLVVAGGLAPFRDITPAVMKQNTDWGPLGFMRSMLCLSRALKPTCSAPARFDIWSTHPYTSGGPTHHAVLPDDVSLGDLPKMRRVLQAAVRAHHIRSRGPVKFWVTEFSWDSNPPDPKGVPIALMKRWVPQALYVMWQSGVSLVTWFSLRDQPLATSFYQSGLYFGSGKPKPFLEGFRFPFVAFPRAGGVYVWGRTPFGEKEEVAIERRTTHGWRQIGVVSTDRYGILQHRFAVAPTGWMRARVMSSGERSLAFSLTAVPDRFFNPFGETTLLEPGHG